MFVVIKNQKIMKTKICVICEYPITGYSNNPYPIKEEGECCDVCNITRVIPARIAERNLSYK